jgi:hypothetical protein
VPVAAHVGGREAELPAPALAAHHDAVDPMRPAQRLGGLTDLAGVDAGTDERGGQRHVVVAQHPHPFGREPEPGAKPTQQLEIASGLVTEAEVLPHHHQRRVQPLDEHHVHELVGVQPAELGGERQYAERVHAELLDQLGLAPDRAEHGRVAARPDDLARVRVEGHHHQRQAEVAGPGQRAADQCLVTAVNAVEDTDRHHAPTPPRGRVVDPPPAQHRVPSSAPVAG